MYSEAKAVLRRVARKYMITVPDILSRRRRKWQVIARQEAMRRMRDELLMSYSEIAFILRMKNHTSAMYGVKKGRERLTEKNKRGLDR